MTNVLPFVTPVPWPEEDLAIPLVEHFESEQTRERFLFMDRAKLPDLEKIARWLCGMTGKLKGAARDLYRERPLAPRARLTRLDTPRVAMGLTWLPVMEVYERRIHDGFQAKNPWDEFLENADLYGVLAHHLENGATGPGVLSFLACSDADADEREAA